MSKLAMKWRDLSEWVKLTGKGSTMYLPADSVNRITVFDDNSVIIHQESVDYHVFVDQTPEQIIDEMNRAIQVQYDKITAEKDAALAEIRKALSKATDPEQLLDLNDFTPKNTN